MTPARVLITGAAGFVGRSLAAHLRSARQIGPIPIGELRLLDTEFPDDIPTDGIQLIQGSIADRRCVRTAWGAGIDFAYHLASIPGGRAEQDYPLSRDVNVLGTMALLEAAKSQAERGGGTVFVFASSVAVFGSPLPTVIDDESPPRPAMTYGSQKLIGETLVADFSRRGWLDGRSLRLAGVLARPKTPTGQMSAFLSDMIRSLVDGQPFVCPMSPEATTWALSIRAAVASLVHAATLDATHLSGTRAITLPALRFSMTELAEAAARVGGNGARSLISYQPVESIEELFGRYPPLRTPLAERLGFRHDGDLPSLVRKALAEPEMTA